MSKGEVTYEVRADYSNVESDLDQANDLIEKKVSGGAEKLKNVAGKTAKAIGVGMLTAGTAVVTVGTAAVNSAVSMDQAMNSFIASTGKGTEEAERYQNVLENIYKNNYGEDFQDIADAMGQVTKNLGDMDDTALQEVTESAFALRDTFEYDLSESTRAAKAMMDQFGISGSEAMSMIAAGAQNGLDYSGELLDSISEYSAQFAKVGLDADDMFKIFQKGAETGAWNLDKVGDAIKEMSIRVIDGSDSTKEGFESIRLDADKMAKKFAEGGESAKEAFQQTVEALASLEDPLKQDAAGVALFGTMWEDLGPEVVTALADIEDGAYDAADAMEGIKKVKYNDLGSMFEGLKRTVEMLLLPLGEELIPILAELLESIMPIVEEALPPLMDLFQQLIEPITEIINAVLPVLIELMNALFPIFQILIDLLMPVIDLFMELLQPILSLISEALVPLLDALMPIISVIADLLVPILQVLFTRFSEVFSGIVSTVSEHISRIAKHINLIVDFIKNVFTGNWKAAWQNVIDIFKNIFGMIGNICKAPINLIIDSINGFIKGINKIKVPDWVPGVGGKSIKLPTIPRLRIGMDYVPSDDFPALLHKGEAVLTAQENALYRSVGGFNGIISSISERGYHDSHNGNSKTIIIHSHVELDGREVARSTAEYIGEQLPWEEL